MSPNNTQNSSFRLFLGGYESSLLKLGEAAKPVVKPDPEEEPEPTPEPKTRGIIRRKTTVIDLNYVPEQAPQKSKWDKNLITTSLKDNFLFEHLNDEELGQVISTMTQVSYKEGEMFAKQGEIGECLFVVEKGEVTELTDGETTSSFERGAVFGETAILHDQLRIHSFKAKTDVRLWSLGRTDFQTILAKNSNEEDSEMIVVLRKVRFLNNLSDVQLSKIGEALEVEEYKKGEKIIKKGEMGTTFYILKDGTALMHDIGKGDSQFVDEKIGPGDYFGARALLTGESRWMNVSATSPCSVFKIEKKTVENVVGDINKLLTRAVKRRALMGIPIFANSTFHAFEIEDLVDAMVDVTLPAGTNIEDKNALYLIWKGAVRVANDDGMIFSLTSGDHFGGYNLIPSIKAVDQRITVDEDAICRKLDHDAINNIIKNMARLGKPMPPISSVFDNTINLKDIKKLSVLGQGAFGKVWLATLNRDKKPMPYALKTMVKKSIANPFEAKCVIMEKNIMASVDHPFLVSIVAAFQDEHMLYMLQGFLQGGELRSLVEKAGKGLDPSAAKFYAACILDGMAYMHKRDIVYRDLKPENVMIDGEGYGIIIDMGLSKVLKTPKTFTMCGTYPYMAPEFFLGKGHNQSADWWTFGVVVYELLTSRQPFTGRENGLVKEIIGVRYRFVKGFEPTAKDLVKNLIQKNRAKRLGNMAGGVQDIYDHPWFKDINFEKLLQKKIKAPWVPVVKNPLDASSFGDFSKLEKENTASMKITAKQQKMFSDF